MPKRSALPGDCMVARSLEVLGEWWTFLIIRDAFFGIRHFEAFQASLGIARNVLSARLSKLVETGILDRRPDASDGRRIEYRLTAKGKALLPTIVSIAQWGAENMRCGDEPVPYQFFDRANGEPIPHVAVRAADGRVLGPRDIGVQVLIDHASEGEPSAARPGFRDKLGVDDAAPRTLDARPRLRQKAA